MSEICSKLIIKTLERRQWLRSGVLTIEQFPHIALVFTLLTLQKLIPTGYIDFAKINSNWVYSG